MAFPARRVYVDWLAERLAGVADLDASKCSLANFRRSRARRGKGRGPEGPDATLHGELLVRNPAESPGNCNLEWVGTEPTATGC